MGGVRYGIWTDNPAGLDTDLAVFGNPNIGTSTSRVGTLYAVNVIADNIAGDTTLANNDYLDSVDAAGTGTVRLLKADASDRTVLNTDSTRGIFSVSGTEYGSWTTTSLKYVKYVLTDGSDKNYSLTVYGAGTAYALTNTPAAIDLGTTDPVKVIDKAGTYILFARVNLQYAGATFAANRTVTLSLQRTNNTPAAVTNSSTALGTGVTTTVTGTMAVVNLPPVLYTTTNTDDSLTIYADVSVVPSAGALNATEASIVAVRLY